MKAPFLFTLLFVSFSTFIQAGEAVVRGTINPFTDIPEILLVKNVSWQEGSNQRLKAPVSESGAFEFKISIDELAMFSLSIDQTSVPILLEPNDFITIEANPQAVVATLKFSGQGSSKNQALYAYYQSTQYDFNPFSYRKYKKGQLWFSIAPNIESQMMSNPSQNFLLKIESDRQLAWANFNKKYTQDATLSEAFKQYINTEIEYSYAYKLLAYHMAYKGRHGLQNEMLNHVESFANQLDTNKLANYWYRNFMLHYYNYKCILDEKNYEPTYSAVNNVYKNHLKGDILAFCQSELLESYIRKEGPIKYMDDYNEFVEKEATEKFHNKVVAIFNEKSKGFAGLPAPDFRFNTLDGAKVTLGEQLNSKYVLINFWATWCKPCIKKMNNFKQLENMERANEIEIIHVSLDREREKLESYIQTHGIQGKHVWAKDASNQNQIDNFKIQALPAWSLINKNGIYEDLPSSTVADLVEHLRTLIQP